MDEQPGIDLSSPPSEPSKPSDASRRPPAPREASSTGPGVAAPLAEGERDVALGDRVKAVQRKGFLKRHRLEVGVTLPGTINDAFYQKLGLGLKVGYHLDDSFALQVRGVKYTQLRTGHVREGRVAFSSQLLASQIDQQVMADGVWSPVYGKVAWLGSKILHFDVYLLGGVGLVWSATSVAPRSEGPHVAGDLGGGVRFYPTSWLGLDAGVIATLYPDQPLKSVPSTLQKVVAAGIGFTVFYPFNFEYTTP